ncbi:unnamed protein product (macronuclear) [Paramecium tetraurelia]|uniref:Uncharacterized protein n=1 Tax=Paramecium tetraurelia TaxID=5888 RepID=A0C410_PARTE|nr:uncharacterized protein GSPATT00035007001 [Paramecium tetraurelia]CAK65527.1 unnamed protein product [Paramecium tetraurelia]|eukprot:XP_001432924.1 hypothetical protein (macronuclear) [Paramecium tetraurelia strain d4-2]
MSFPQKKIRILSEVTTISRNQDPYQIQSSQKQNDQGFPQQKIIRNSSNYEQGNRLTLRPHNQILSKEFGLQPPQHIQPNRLSSSMMDKSQQNTAQRNASIRIISGPNPQKNIKFKVINQEDKQKMAILMSPNEYQLKQSSQKHQENHRQIYMPQMDAILQKRAQEPSNQSNPNLEQFQNQQYFQQQYLLQQQQQQYYQQSQQQQQQQSQSQQQQQSQQQSYQQSKQQQKQQQQTQQVVQQSQKKLISQKQQQQQEQQQQQQKFLAVNNSKNNNNIKNLIKKKNKIQQTLCFRLLR